MRCVACSRRPRSTTRAMCTWRFVSRRPAVRGGARRRVSRGRPRWRAFFCVARGAPGPPPRAAGGRGGGGGGGAAGAPRGGRGRGPLGGGGARDRQQGGGTARGAPHRQ